MRIACSTARVNAFIRQKIATSPGRISFAATALAMSSTIALASSRPSSYIRNTTGGPSSFSVNNSLAFRWRLWRIN